jgi:hypothetical protein
LVRWFAIAVLAAQAIPKIFGRFWFFVLLEDLDLFFAIIAFEGLSRFR